MDVRIKNLQEQLESRKLESLKLKKKQKKLRLENLKSKEQDLLKQIDLYDKKIEESKKFLMVELEKKKIEVTKLSIKHDSHLKNSSSIIQNVTNDEINNFLEKSSELLNISDDIMITEKNKYLYPTLIKKLNNENQDNPIPLAKSVYELQQNFSNKSKDNLDGYAYDCVSIKVDNCMNKSLETNQVHKVLPLNKELTTLEVNSFNGIQSKIPYFKSQSLKISIPSSSDLREKLNEETHKNKINNDIDINVKIPCCDYSIINQDKLNTLNDQAFYLENNANIKNSTLSFVNSSNESSSNSNNIQKIMFDDFSGECNERENSVNHTETAFKEIELEDNYSPDFILDENISEFKRSYEFEPCIMESQDITQNNESSYEENKSVGEIVIEDNTFIEQFSDDSDLVS